MIGWLWRETTTLFSDVEYLFVEGRLPSPPEVKPPPTGRQPQAKTANRSVFGGPIPDWMHPTPSVSPRKGLPMEVVSALMTLGLASPPAKEQLKKMIRRALANAHPDRHPPEDHAQMRQRLHAIQEAREVLRRHNYA